MKGNELLARAAQLYGTPPQRVLIAYSGGLDSLLCAALLARLWGRQYLTLVFYKVGQRQREIDEAVSRAEENIALSPEIVDLVPQLTSFWIPRAIQANALYAGYPIAAPFIKQLIGKHIAATAVDRGIGIIVEGSSGKGNDQFRMHASINRFQSGLTILAPVRDLNLTRHDELSVSDEWELAYDPKMPQGGDDQTLWCHSIASGALDLNEPVPRPMFIWYRAPEDPDADASAFDFAVDFERGVPVGFNGRKEKIVDLIELLNAEGGRRSIGFVDVVEEGILEMKSREIYEAPAAIILIRLHSELERLCLTQRHLDFKKKVDDEWVKMIYGGHAFHPLLDCLNAFIDQSQETVTGRIDARLNRGRISITKRRSPYSLLDPLMRNIQYAQFDQRLSSGAVFFHSINYAFFRRNEGHGGD